MSENNSIFVENNQVTPEVTNQVKTEDLNTLLSEVKNDKGEPKYKSPEEAIKALKHSQEYIPQLSNKVKEYQEENERLRKEAEKVSELEEVIKRLKPSENTPPATAAKEVSEEDIVSKIENVLFKKESERQQKQNLETVVNTLSEKLGSEAEKQFYEKAKELGMSALEINALASKAPLAVLQLFGVKEVVKNKTTVNTSSINTSSFEPQQTSYIGRNTKSVLIGATSQEIVEESRKAAELVKELHAQNKSIYDLTDPKVYFKTFK